VNGPLRHRRLAALALAAGLALAAPARAQEPTLSLTLHLSAPAGAGTVGADLTAGIAPGAGPGYDPGLDSRAYRLGALQAWFFDPSLPERARRLMRDYRDGAGAEAWTVQVTTPAGDLGGTVETGSPVTVTWGPPENASGLCTGRSLTLVDVDGGGLALDMATQASHTIPAPGPGATHTLELQVGPADAAAAAAPDPPSRLYSPVQGRRGVLLVWSPAGGAAAAYHVERTDTPGDPDPPFERLTDAPVREARYVDADVVGRGTVGYRVVAVSGSGCESAPSDTLVVTP
jgi:hypothetical protein